jgi:hypothetical protein
MKSKLARNSYFPFLPWEVARSSKYLREKKKQIEISTAEKVMWF